MFLLKTTLRPSWSYHLAGDTDMAMQILEEFKKSQKIINRDLVGHFMKKMFNKKNDYDYEHSELLLYKNLVLELKGELNLLLKT